MRFLNGARDGTRTHDLLITNQLRYQLRHSSGYSLYVACKRDKPIQGVSETGLHTAANDLLHVTGLLYTNPRDFSSHFCRRVEKSLHKGQRDLHRDRRGFTEQSKFRYQKRRIGYTTPATAGGQ